MTNVNLTDRFEFQKLKEEKLANILRIQADPVSNERSKVLGRVSLYLFICFHENYLALSTFRIIGFNW